MATTTFMLHYEDQENEAARQTYYLDGVVSNPAAAAPAALVAAIEGISDAAIVKVTLLPTDSSILGATVDAEYSDIEDKVTFYCKSASGLSYKFALPCPEAGIFLADKETVDLADPDVVNMVTIIQSTFKATDGTALTVLRGARTRTKNHKR